MHRHRADETLRDENLDRLPRERARDAKAVAEDRDGDHLVLRHLREELVVRGLLEEDLVVGLLLVLPLRPLLLLSLAAGLGLGGLGGLRFRGFRRLRGRGVRGR